MKHYFQAEQLKYRHTSVAAITLGMPVFTALLAFWLTSSYFSVDVYNWWYIGLYPGFLGILCSIIGKKDKQKKNYTIWSLPCGMEQIWDAKILVGIKMSVVGRSDEYISMEYESHFFSIGRDSDFRSPRGSYLVSQFGFCLVCYNTDIDLLWRLSFFYCIDFTVVAVA